MFFLQIELLIICIITMTSMPFHLTELYERGLALKVAAENLITFARHRSQSLLVLIPCRRAICTSSYMSSCICTLCYFNIRNGLHALLKFGFLWQTVLQQVETCRGPCWFLFGTTRGTSPPIFAFEGISQTPSCLLGMKHSTGGRVQVWTAVINENEARHCRKEHVCSAQ